MPCAEILKSPGDQPASSSKVISENREENERTAYSILDLTQLLERFPSGGAGLSILDVGCGYGTRLRLAADKQWKCFGTEASA